LNPILPSLGDGVGISMTQSLKGLDGRGNENRRRTLIFANTPFLEALKREAREKAHLKGKIVHEFSVEDLEANPQVKEKYLAVA
jgi:hypothetical protein